LRNLSLLASIFASSSSAIAISVSMLIFSVIRGGKDFAGR
jgi:hypothetical protein